MQMNYNLNANDEWINEGEEEEEDEDDEVFLEAAEFMQDGRATVEEEEQQQRRLVSANAIQLLARLFGIPEAPSFEAEAGIGASCGEEAQETAAKSLSSASASASATASKKQPLIFKLRQQSLSSSSASLSYSSSSSCRTNILKNLFPNKFTGIIEKFHTRAYSGQFSSDGSFFYACTQDFRVHLFDSQSWIKKQHFNLVGGRWTVTDCSLSSDNRFMIYSSISPLVSISKVGHFQNYDTDGQANEDDGGISELNSLPSETSVLRFGEENFGIWSLRFSGDNREIVAGTSAATIVVYDIESRSVLHTIDGHNDDVNAVAFADTSNSHVLFSGSDDSLVKIWDRRSLGRNCKPSGTLVGHTEGITFIESKGDGRYCLSNSKDQSAKLWDIRRMLNEQQADESCKISYQRNWDYRWQRYPGKPPKHPFDCSILTMRGHAVLKTLIRCHFSPERFGGQRYVYTGSADGLIHIYDTLKDGEIAKIISIKDSLRSQQDTSPAADIDDETESTSARRQRQRFFQLDETDGLVTRDVSWHPELPVLVATTFGSRESAEDGGCLIKHEYVV